MRVTSGVFLGLLIGTNLASQVLRPRFLCDFFDKYFFRFGTCMKLPSLSKNNMKKVEPTAEFFTNNEELGKFRAATAEANVFSVFFTQLSIMFKRNILLQVRNWQTTLSQVVLAPLIFHLLLFILQQADYARQRTSNLDPESSTLAGLVGCQGRNEGDPCIDIMYTPAIEPYTSMMASFASSNLARDGVEYNIATDFPQSIAAPTKSFGNETIL
jgi:hypothetical protein